jgi:tetratricopeptide (TPR) repeat protein
MNPEAATLQTQATEAYQQAEYETAARLFGEAALAFEAEKAPLQAAEMKNNQSVSALQAGDLRQALSAAQGTAPLFAQAEDWQREGIAHANEGSALRGLGRKKEALAAFQRSAAAFEKANQPEMRAEALLATATLQLEQRKWSEALLSYQIGLAGLKHPTLQQKIILKLLRLRSW